MSSLGAIATSAIFAIIVIASIGSLTSVMFLSHDLLRKDIMILWEDASRTGGRIEVISASILHDNRSIEALLLNRGAGGIRVADFKKIDIIVVHGRGGAKWLPYDPGEGLEAGWKPLSITCEGRGETINPTSPDFSSGMWDSGEILAIRIWLDSPIEEPFKLIIVSPEGVEGA